MCLPVQIIKILTSLLGLLEQPGKLGLLELGQHRAQLAHAQLAGEIGTVVHGQVGQVGRPKHPVRQHPPCSQVDAVGQCSLPELDVVAPHLHGCLDADELDAEQDFSGEAHHQQRRQHDEAGVDQSAGHILAVLGLHLVPIKKRPPQELVGELPLVLVDLALGHGFVFVGVENVSAGLGPVAVVDEVAEERGPVGQEVVVLLADLHLIIIQAGMKQQGKIFLLVGYLGSGKTTFIRNLLTNKNNQKYAVIQNQFAEGQMGIEQSLIMDESGVPFSSFLELPNGCICCSAKNDLVAGVEYILKNTDVSNIIVETNGLADPAQAIKQFWFDESTNMGAELHSIIAVVSVPRYLGSQQEALLEKQIAYANKILLTFVDKSTEEQVLQVVQAVREKNSECLVAKNSDYNVVQFLAGANMFDISSLGLNKQQGHHGHHGIKSLHIRGRTACSNKSEFEYGVGQLLWESGIKILRLKGVISFEGQEYVYELQGVEDVFEIKETKTLKSKFNSQCVMLVIGQEMDENQIRKILKII